MNTTRIHIIGLLMALAAFLWTSCSDDELYRSNELGSRLEEMGDFKLSSFTLEKGIWEIADTIQQIKIHLKSHTDDSIRAYDAAVLHSESNPSYSIYIPKTDEIPDRRLRPDRIPYGRDQVRHQAEGHFPGRDAPYDHGLNGTV